MMDGNFALSVIEIYMSPRDEIVSLSMEYNIDLIREISNNLSL